MARRSLRPQLNQIRTWVRQGRTDAWIAHQLEVTGPQIAQFKRENDLAPAEPETGTGTDFDDEIDLRAEDDALIAAELDAAEAEVEEADDADDADDSGGDDDTEDKPAPRRRGRRGGRRRKKGPVVLEGSFDHGEEGYGLWLDPAVQEHPLYAEHWAGHRPVEVTVEEDQIVIRRAGEPGDGDDD